MTTKKATKKTAKKPAKVLTRDERRQLAQLKRNKELAHGN